MPRSRNTADEPGEVLRVVGLGEVAALLAAYRTACTTALRLRAWLDAQHLAGQVMAVVAAVDDTGDPIVHVSLTMLGAVRLLRLTEPPARQPGPVAVLDDLAAGLACVAWSLPGDSGPVDHRAAA